MTFTDYFKAKNYGLLEFIVVLYPILKQYSAPIISLGDWLLIFAGISCIFKAHPPYKCLPLIVLIIYIILHEIVVGFAIGGAPIYMINGTIDKILPLILIFFIVPFANYTKICNCFYVVGAVCMLGLLYHVILVFVMGQPVSPLTIPFLKMSILENLDYVGQVRLRPVSFFAEPAAYAAFMLFPLAICLMENKVKYALIISVFTLLSTSSNGYFQTGAMWIVFLLFNNSLKIKNKFLIIAIIAVGIVYIGNSDLFSFGIEKIQGIDIQDDDRVSAGFYAFMNMPFDVKVFGVVAATPFDYIATHHEVIQGINIGITDRSVYLPMIWFYGIKYGLIGIIMVFACLFYGWKRVELKPLIIACTMSFFTQSVTLVMPMFVILLFRYSHPVK